MKEHLTEGVIVWGGFLATATSDIAGLPHWMTYTIGFSTLVYTVFKMGMAAIRFRQEWKHRDDTKVWAKNRNDED